MERVARSTAALLNCSVPPLLTVNTDEGLSGQEHQRAAADLGAARAGNAAGERERAAAALDKVARPADARNEDLGIRLIEDQRGVIAEDHPARAADRRPAAAVADLQGTPLITVAPE